MSTRSFESVMGGALVQVVLSAENVGLLSALEAPANASELADRLGLSERAVRLALEVLGSIGYVEHAGEVYRRPPLAREALEEIPALDQFLRTGAVPEYIDQPGRRGAYYTEGVLALGEAQQGAARQLAAQLRPARRVVDVGAGSAIWSLAMVEAHGGEVVAIDQPEVLPTARQMARAMGLEQRLAERAGDYFDVVAEGGADRVVLANVLHLESEENAARLIRLHAATLGTDGEMVIVDILGGSQFEARLFWAVYQLHLGMRTHIGRAHPVERLGRWCGEVGLSVQRVVGLEPAGLGALVCRRPWPPLKQASCAKV